MADIPTVKIQDGHGGFIIINESDFDPKTHKRFMDKEMASSEKAADAATAKADKNAKK